jgi:D-xylose 1-dehydrogenase (NADP+, D-xylono-1,5-lactone-forming)
MQPPSLPRLRWGIVGAARIARSAIVPALRSAGQDIVAVAARDPSRAESFAAEFDIGHRPDYRALIEDNQIDAIYIALTNDAHVRWTMAALDAGKHVLCEKPLALTSDAVEAMREAETRSGKVLMEAYCHIFHPQYADLVEQIEGGAIGDLVTIEISLTNPLLDKDDWRWSAAMGGGAAYDLMGYCATLATLVAKKAPDSVVARQRVRGEVDLAMMASLDFGDCLASLHASFVGAKQQRMTLVGTKSAVTLEHPIVSKNRDVVLKLAGFEQSYPPLDPYKNMIEDFIAAAAGQKPLAFPSAASLVQAQLTDRMKRAAIVGIAA